uniref:Uncharacterized protein n=1 Tax=Kwoniella bestiolae CBS 10118 TaxID=1296100 RepID=A0A1B9G5A7_9TREE|nr:hypothetical protein I302_03893 [Kwoniella bestiolae CBS 10118]OCF26214.1 hypothetical protein I302_03893 [Kwoniella bestiolae CBS 10118]
MNHRHLSRSSTQPLAPTDLNPQPLNRSTGIEHLAESSKSRKFRAMEVVSKIGRALSITKSKDRKVSLDEATSAFPTQPSKRYQQDEGLRPKPLKPHVTGPVMMPLRDDEWINRGRRRGAQPPIPLRSRHPTSSVQVAPEPLYSPEWNHSLQARSLFEMPLSTVPVPETGHRDPFSTTHSTPRSSHRPQRADRHRHHPTSTASALEERPLNTFSESHGKRPITRDKPSSNLLREATTPHKLKDNVSRRKPIPSSYLNESFESLIERTTPTSVKESWRPLNIVRRPSSIMLDNVKHHETKDTIHTPPTPNSGRPSSFHSPSPSPSPTPSAGCVGTFEDSLLHDQPENSFEVGQDNLYDEVLTSWNLPPLSRSNSLALDKIPTSSIRPEEREQEKLSKSTGMLDHHMRKERETELKSVPAFYPSGRSFEPIRTIRCSDMLRTAQYGNPIYPQQGRGDKRKMSGRVKKAVEVFEGRRDPSESPPTPWKEMAKLLKRKESDSSIRLQDETRRMSELEPSVRSEREDVEAKGKIEVKIG